MPKHLSSCAPPIGFMTRFKAPIVSFLVYFPFVLGLVAGSIGALRKWVVGKPEWCYYRMMVGETLEKATGPDEKLFGYLPGAKALLTPFVRLEPAGYYLFLLLSVVSCLGVFIVLRKSIQKPIFQRQRLKADLWLSICLAAPTYLAIQNNQLVSFSFFFLLCAFAAARNQWGRSAGILFAFAALVKTLPLVASGFLVLTGRWRSVFWGLALLVVFSFGLAAWTDGSTASYALHRIWPSQVSEQNAMEILEGDVPFSFDVNQSPSSQMVRLAMVFDTVAIAYVWQFVFWASLCALCLFTLLKRDFEGGYWIKAAAWLAWIAFAAPFGRYYYLLFCVPLWYLLGWPSGGARITLRLIGWSAPVFVLTAGAGNPSYAIYAGLSFFLSFIPLTALRNRDLPLLFSTGISRLAQRLGLLSQYVRTRKFANIYTLFAAACFLAGGLVALGHYRVCQSEKSIVKAFQSLRRDGCSDLSFIVKDLAEAGPKFRLTATVLDDSDDKSIRTLLVDGDEDFIVVNYQQVPDFVGEFGQDAFDLVFRDGVYFLLREVQAPAAPAG